MRSSYLGRATTGSGAPNPFAGFAGKVTRTDDGCWLAGPDGTYPRASIAGKNQTLHRHVWEYVNGEIPDGHHVHHKCRMTNCINPDHLVALPAGDHHQTHFWESRKDDPIYVEDPRWLFIASKGLVSRD